MWRKLFVFLVYVTARIAMWCKERTLISCYISETISIACGSIARGRSNCSIRKCFKRSKDAVVKSMPNRDEHHLSCVSFGFIIRSHERFLLHSLLYCSAPFYLPGIKRFDKSNMIAHIMSSVSNNWYSSLSSFPEFELQYELLCLIY